MQDGDTALHLGATKGHFNVCDTLIRAGADVMVVNKVGLNHCIFSYTHYPLNNCSVVLFER